MVVEKGYKQTEVGMIPLDWDVQPINAIATVIRGASPRPKGDKRYYGGNIPRLMVEDVTRDGKYVTPSVDFLTEEGAKRSRPCKQGTLTIVCSGTVGIPSFLKVDACIHDGFLGLTNIQKNTSSDYLYYQFVKLREVFDKSATHGGIFTNLTTAGVKEFLLPLPNNLEEQIAIATALSDMDELIAQTEKLIEKKKAIKQGVMQELLRPKEGWVTKKLGTIATFYKGKGLPKSHIIEYGKFKCIHYGELFTKYQERISDILSYTDQNHDCFYSQINDVLMPTSDVTPNGLATASCVKEDMIILGGDVLVIRTIPNILDGIFLAYYISQNKEKIMKLVTGSTVYHLYGSDMKDFEVSFPEKSTQEKIIEVISDLSIELSVLENRFKKLKLQKQGMLQALLTGKIRLV